MLTAMEQLSVIQKGALEIIDEAELILKLERSISTGKPLIIKLGLDPTAPDIHLGHTVVLRKIKQMQDLGHKAIIIIGDFTGRIGDPTGRSKARKQLSEEEVLRNADTYEKQISRILAPEKTTLLFNSSWLGELNFSQVIELSSQYTVARMLERDDFKNRFQNNQPIGIHEFFYPLMQAYDSLETNADIEIGGTEQRFNILMGRDLQGKSGKEKQVALFMPLLVGLDGLEKMSKSLGNYIGISEEPNVMYTKVMTIPDPLMFSYFELCTDLHPTEISKLQTLLEQNAIHPKDLKMQLAREIVTLYHGGQLATEAEQHFITVFAKKENPETMQELISTIPIRISEALLSAGLAKSNSEARRLVEQGGVQVNGIRINVFETILQIGDIVKVGKKTFLKIV